MRKKMKNRRIPYGYEMKNGSIVICESESVVVKQIFADYIGGKNLKSIADSLMNRKIEYLPAETGWNKNRIKRIIEDKRYIGDNIYPNIIQEEILNRANEVKTSRCKTRDSKINKDCKLIKSKMFCGECGNLLHHKTDNAKSNTETWSCKNCKMSVKMTLEDVEKQITVLLNKVIHNTELIMIENTNDEEIPSEIICMENEIERMLEQVDFDKEKLQDKILQCAAKKYTLNMSVQHITDRLKADFEKSSPLLTFSADLFDKTVSSVILTKDKSISIILKNRKVIKG